MPSIRRDQVPGWRKLAAAALALVVAAGGGVAVYRAVSGPASCGQTVAPFRLVTTGGECVGVTDATTGYYFDPANPVAVRLQYLIGQLNGKAEQSKHYLTIALVDALTTSSSPEEDVSSPRIDDMLNGAYIAWREPTAPWGFRYASCWRTWAAPSKERRRWSIS